MKGSRLQNPRCHRRRARSASYYALCDACDITVSIIPMLSHCVFTLHSLIPVDLYPLYEFLLIISYLPDTFTAQS